MSGVELGDMSNTHTDVAAWAAGVAGPTVEPVPVEPVPVGEPLVPGKRQSIDVHNLAFYHPRSTIFLIIVFLTIWIMAGLGMKDKKGYFTVSGIIIGVLVAFTILGQFMRISYLVAAASVGLFCWYAWDTYKTYSSSGQQGMANVQVLLMVSLLLTIVISKLVLSSGGGGLPEMVSVFFTVVSFSLIYLINNLTKQACSTPKDFDYEAFFAHAALFIVIYSLTGHHPLIALAVSVAAFAYFSYSAKQLKDSQDADDGKSGQNTESTNIVITTFLIMYSVFKIMFPTFSVRSITNSKPVVLFVNILTVCAILSFIVTNVLYSAGANKKTMLGVLVGMNGLISVVMTIRGFAA